MSKLPKPELATEYDASLRGAQEVNVWFGGVGGVAVTFYPDGRMAIRQEWDNMERLIGIPAMQSTVSVSIS